MRVALRWLLTVVMVVAGTLHFVRPATYLAMMPPVLPWPLGLVYLSGLCEILGGLGLILPATRRAAAWGLIALFVAVFPANLYMALEQLPLGGQPVAAWVLWLRLPFQAVLIAWAYGFARGPAVGDRTAASSDHASRPRRPVRREAAE